ncbi:MAG: hypothetical protein HN790_13720, partial [Methylococcales bacterium]|nr:hypothetical protein [Methylococcales bacterium]
MTYEPNDVPLYTFYFNRTIIAVIALMPIPLASNMAINHGMPGIVLIGVLALAITMLSLSFRKAMVIYEDRIEYRSSPIYALKTCYKSAITQIEVRKNMLLIHEGKHTTKMMLNLYKAKDKQQLEI